MGAGSLQQHIGAHDIGLDEGAGAVDGAIHVGLGRQMHDHIRIDSLQQRLDRRGVADVSPGEAVMRMSRDAFQRGERACVGELVQNMDVMIGLVQQMPNQRRPDEPRPAGDHDLH